MPSRISRPIPRPVGRPPQTSWQQLHKNPSTYLAKRLFRWWGIIESGSDPATPRPQHLEPGPPSSTQAPTPIVVVCISDTHCTTPPLPPGDLLVHAGDLTDKGDFEELQAQIDWLKAQCHQHKIVIGGNHDRLLDKQYVERFPDRICESEGKAKADLDWGDVIYLENSPITLDFAGGDGGRRKLTVYGCPLTPMCGTFAFQYPPIREVWEGRVPDGTDLLLTHGPPRGHLDSPWQGCPQLLAEICRVRPKLVVFGHIHGARGCEEMGYSVVETMYNGVIAGRKGLGAVMVMAIFVAFEALVKCLGLSRLFLDQWKKTRVATRLVNAAMVGGVGNIERNSPIVVEI